MISLQHDFEEAVTAIKAVKPGDLLLFTLRHGESWGQLNQNLYKEMGDDALPITPLGVRQSIAAGKFAGCLMKSAGIREVDVITSTGRRSTTTAKLLQEAMQKAGLIVHYREDIRYDKQKFGKFDGFFTSAEREKNRPEAYREYVLHEKPKGAFHARPPGGESIADVQARIADGLRDISDNPRPVFLVTHGTNTLCIENGLMDRGEQWVLDNVDKRPNCSIHLNRGNGRDGFVHTIVANDPLAWFRMRGRPDCVLA